MFSIKYLIYDLKFVHMVLLVLHDKQFDLVKTPIKFTDELLQEQDGLLGAIYVPTSL